LSSTGRLSEKQIAQLSPRRTRYVVWDGAMPGFGVRVSPTGAKSFVLKFRLKTGRVRWATWNPHKVSLEQARTRARSYLGAVADGKDPLRAIDLARDAATVNEVADLFLTEHVIARRKPATQRLYQTAIDCHIRPRFGAMAIRDLTPSDVGALHHRLRATPVMANRVLAVCSKLLNWSEQRGYRETNTNPCRGIEKNRELARRRYLTAEEMRRLGAALRVAERWHAMSPTAVTAIKLLLLTGTRVSEILSLRWRDVDLAGAALHLPDSKTGRKTILLNLPAVDILQAWPRHAASPYVFPGEGREGRKGKHRVNLTDAWGWIRKRARIPDVRLHDLRHSFASVAVSSGLTLPVIGALLGHTQPNTTARYSHLMADPLRAASDLTGTTIAAAIGRRQR
jgi:integrase